ncbi:hypothetical protein [Nocardia sp. NPDC048505]|uniref:hypothetical protein n=1 Tax=unclassified Nocardia TaxID=2637762 RepID=UPI0033DD92DF
MARMTSQADLRDSNAELKHLAGRTHATSVDLKARLARFAGASTAAEERAEIDTVFGPNRLDG